MSKRMFAMSLAIALMIAPFAAAQTASSPKLTVTDAVKDFGTVAKGEMLDWSFEVRNTGQAPLEILSVRPTCGCTVADFDKVIMPGKTGKITAHVDTTGFSGPISKAVNIETNDPQTPTSQLTITAIVKPYVEAFPAGFVRFNQFQGESSTQFVTLYSEETEPFEIVKIQSPQPWIQVQHTKAEGDARAKAGRAGQNQYRMAITVANAPDGKLAREGMINEKILVQTNSKHQPEYWISVTGLIRPTVHVAPQMINMGEVRPGDSALSGVIAVRSLTTNADAFMIEKAESNNKNLKATIAPLGGGQFDVKLQVAPDAQAGDLNGEVTIYTNDTLRPKITIPVVGTVMAPSTAAK